MTQFNNESKVTTNLWRNSLNTPQILEALATANEAKEKVTAYIGPSQIKPKLDEGRYLAITTNATYILNKQTKNGLRNCIEVTFSIFASPDKEPVELRKFYWETENNTFYDEHQFSCLLGYDARKGFHVSDLIGKYCEVEITHYTASAYAVYSNITNVYSVEIPTNTDTNTPIYF